MTTIWWGRVCWIYLFSHWYLDSWLLQF